MAKGEPPRQETENLEGCSPRPQIIKAHAVPERLRNPKHVAMLGS